MGKETILYLRTDLNPFIKSGGSVSHTIGIIDSLKKNFDVLCFSSAMINHLKKHEGIKFFPLKYIPIFWFLRRSFWVLRERLDMLFSNFFFILQILFRIRKRKIKFIYQRYSLLNCVGVLLKKIKKIPVVLEYNGSEARVARLWGDDTRDFPFVYKVEEYNLKNADYISVVSAVLKDELLEIGIEEKKIIVNPNGVDPFFFDPLKTKKSREVVRSEYGCLNKIVFGFVGTFSYWHGVEIINDIILKLVPNNKDNIHFLLVGGGPLKKDFEENIKNLGLSENVTFTGLVCREKSRDYLSACDIFLCPTQQNSDGSRFFGSPTKLFEYMSMSKLIIASDLEQIAQVISPATRINGLSKNIVPDKDSLGFLIPHDDLDGFINACYIAIAKKNGCLDRIGENARRAVLDKYTWDENIKCLNEVIVIK